MDNELFTRLRKYRPGENRNPTENFVTEAFAWILRNNPQVSSLILKSIIGHEKLADSFTVGDGDLQTPEWSTQASWGVFPDMICVIGRKVIVFEHKVWSPLHANQLCSYRAYAERNYDSALIVLITAHAGQHSDDSDLALCWKDVHAWLSTWQMGQRDRDHVVDCFLALLESEGLGPDAPISHEQILSFYPGARLKQNTINLINRLNLEHNRRVLDDEMSKYGVNGSANIWLHQWGRYGFDLLGRSGQWRPGVFVGFLLECDDHRTSPSRSDLGPDVVVILDFDTDLHKTYPNSSNYIALRERLCHLQKSGQLDGWDVHDHLGASDNPNRWHPLHVRKPMLEVFRGSTDGPSQENQFLQSVTIVLRAVLGIQEFRQLREEFQSISR